MKKNFTTRLFAALFFAVSFGLAVVAGCRSTAGWPGCGSAAHTPQPYAPAASAAPAYSQNYQQPNQGSSSGSGSRLAPLFQGSGTR